MAEDEQQDSPDLTGAAQAAAGGVDQQAQPQPQVQMMAHFVRDLSFENVGAMQGGGGDAKPEINVTANVEAGGVGENRYQVVLKFNGTAKAAESTRFIVELDYAGIFQLANVPQDYLHPIVFIECPRLLLPFARRVIADVTRDGGYPPLMLDNIDFSVLYRQRIAQLQAEQGSAAAAAQDPNGSVA